MPETGLVVICAPCTGRGLIRKLYLGRVARHIGHGVEVVSIPGCAIHLVKLEEIHPVEEGAALLDKMLAQSSGA